MKASLFALLALCLICAVITETSREAAHDAAVLEAMQAAYGDSVQIDPDITKNVTQLITARGYPCEQHYATTSDGYILSIQRIPYSSKSPYKPGKPVVFLQHGVLDSSNTWVQNFEQNTLSFILADAGFDVWLGNVRGNLYCQKNVNYSTDSSAFWSFNWDQHASIDIVTMTEYALRFASQSKLAIVGHSQGSTTTTALLVSNPEFAKKVSIFIALAPVLHMKNADSALMKLLATIHLDDFLQFLGVKQFLPSTAFIEFFLPHVCDGLPWFCKNTYCLVAGCDLGSVNVTRLPVYLSHLPAGSSVQNMAHWAQVMRTNEFKHYDYGTADKNKQHYNQATPPLYKLENLKTKMVVYYGGKDTLADPQDIEQWLPQVPSEYLLHSKLFPTFGHGDFVWGVGADAVQMYHDIVSFISKNM